MLRMQCLMAIVAASALSAPVYARDHHSHHHHHHHHHHAYVLEGGFYIDPAPEVAIEHEPAAELELRGEPIDDRTAEEVEREDARRGAQADRDAAGIVRYPEIEIRNLSRDGHIWIGGEPTLEGYRQVRDRGVKAIVDLRNPTSKQRASAEEARRLGIDYINLPIEPRHMDPRDTRDFMRFMSDHEGEQVLIHCGSANRASAMYAVYLGAVRGFSTDAAIRRARLTGLREASLERDVRDYLDSLPKPSANRSEGT